MKIEHCLLYADEGGIDCELQDGPKEERAVSCENMFCNGQLAITFLMPE